MKQPQSTVAVWDWPTRLFHWGLAMTFVLAWVSSQSERLRDFHAPAGILMLGLFGFRLIWGFIGGRYARFGDFAYSWREALAYLRDLPRGRAQRYLGHNPPGAWAVLALIGMGLAVGLTGVALLGAQEGQGPLALWLPFDISEVLAEVHEAIAIVMLILVLIHIGGVAVESLAHRENLVQAMLTGYKRAGANAPASAMHGRVGAALAAAMVAAAAYFGADALIVRSAGPAARPAESAAWQGECGACHLAYPSSLLPARSWQRLLAQQADHFGEDLALGAAVSAKLGSHVLRRETSIQTASAGYKIARSIPAGDAPLRVTETAYWMRKHQDIAPAVWRRAEVKSRANCGACHTDAEQGTFRTLSIRMPRAVTASAATASDKL